MDFMVVEPFHTTPTHCGTETLITVITEVPIAESSMSMQLHLVLALWKMCSLLSFQIH